MPMIILVVRKVTDHYKQDCFSFPWERGAKILCQLIHLPINF